MPDASTGSAVAVLTAAGSGTRLGARGPKALVEVGGESLLHRAARGLLESESLDHITITAPDTQVERFTAEVADMGGDGQITVVAGSPASRQASVALGLAAALAARPGAEVVLVHDAARALTPPELIRRVVAAVRAGHDAVVPGLPVVDTVKEIDGAGPEPAGEQVRGIEVDYVVGTPDRARLRAIQTPQGFTRSTLEAAHRLGADVAGDEARAARDDASLVEAMGKRVIVVAGDPLALKVTTPLDLALARILARREPVQP
ncbi:2-C-methyl-D-erythritol 4-phosphate cytidylyltransferase [Actinomyces sp. 432]|uniref:IspD/TarI family cytidylyltransferase n=1 Tax=Actinomyces sp. 432 TaxID=2057798 RepID=UPI001373E6BE|nr:2-C-methyl-D-erythritol 4-phosphate cytidylyltransferase [Actinomyces sp. 432]QHO90342.1 2-C-methyl-D-erythritol 4-phosphate cytidylyltransferase [Actinomyces sp. 432]